MSCVALRISILPIAFALRSLRTAARRQQRVGSRRRHSAGAKRRAHRRRARLDRERVVVIACPTVRVAAQRVAAEPPVRGRSRAGGTACARAAAHSSSSCSARDRKSSSSKYNSLLPRRSLQPRRPLRPRAEGRAHAAAYSRRIPPNANCKLQFHISNAAMLLFRASLRTTGLICDGPGRRRSGGRAHIRCSDGGRSVV